MNSRFIFRITNLLLQTKFTIKNANIKNLAFYSSLGNLTISRINSTYHARPLCHARFKTVLRLFRHAKYYTLTGHHLSLRSCKLQSRGLITEKIMEKRRANYCTQQNDCVKASANIAARKHFPTSDLTPYPGAFCIHQGRHGAFTQTLYFTTTNVLSRLVGR